jgi:hypothetical protein
MAESISPVFIFIYMSTAKPRGCNKRPALWQTQRLVHVVFSIGTHRAKTSNIAIDIADHQKQDCLFNLPQTSITKPPSRVEYRVSSISTVQTLRDADRQDYVSGSMNLHSFPTPTSTPTSICLARKKEMRVWISDS